MVVRFYFLLVVVTILTSCSKAPPPENEAELRNGCLATAGSLAGGAVELLKFGHFIPNGPLDCVVAGVLEDIDVQVDGVLASRLLVLRHQGQSWRIALDASKWATNPEGFVGIDSIDDSYDFKGLRVVTDDKGPTGQPGITIWISYLDEGGEDDGAAKAFSLNPVTGRYQEFDEKLGFKPEVRDPPHTRSKIVNP
jgi:hypothetical protein